MKPNPSLATLGLLLTASLLAPSSTADNYAPWVPDYQPGTGSSPGYNVTSAVVGEPARSTPGEFGGPVDPFNAPWQVSQILSLGAGGSVTVRFDRPIFNLPGNPFGLDFSIFGSAAFVITNGDYSGGGITDGSLFGDNPGSSRVSISQDGVTFFALDPALAPTVDGLFPTDGSGDFSRPVNPALKASDFAGLTLDGIRARYAGSGGGTGYDIGWARDTSGNPVQLDQIEYIRVDVLSGRAEIDAFSAVPEPGPLGLFLLGSLALVRNGATRRSPR